MPPAARGENEPFVPLPPRHPGACRERLPGGSVPASQPPHPPVGPAPEPGRRTAPPLEVPSPGTGAKGGRGRTGPWRGVVPPGVLGRGSWEGAVPEQAGAVGFSRVSDGRPDPRQPAGCLLGHSPMGLSGTGPGAADTRVATPSPGLGDPARTFVWEGQGGPGRLCPSSTGAASRGQRGAPAGVPSTWTARPGGLALAVAPTPQSAEEPRTRRGASFPPVRGWLQRRHRQIQTHTDRFRHTQKPTRPTGASLRPGHPPPTRDSGTSRGSRPGLHGVAGERAVPTTHRPAEGSAPGAGEG